MILVTDADPASTSPLMLLISPLYLQRSFSQQFKTRLLILVCNYHDFLFHLGKLTNISIENRPPAIFLLKKEDAKIEERTNPAGCEVSKCVV
jgi:hypothetical protein